MYFTVITAAPVPARPTVSKPGGGGQVNAADKLPPLDSTGTLPDMDILPVTLPSVSTMFDGPKLKDYLPFMKVNWTFKEQVIHRLLWFLCHQILFICCILICEWNSKFFKYILFLTLMYHFLWTLG